MGKGKKSERGCRREEGQKRGGCEEIKEGKGENCGGDVRERGRNGGWERVLGKEGG